MILCENDKIKEEKDIIIWIKFEGDNLFKVYMMLFIFFIKMMFNCFENDDNFLLLFVKFFIVKI